MNFRPASFRRFVRDITRGPDDLMALADAVASSAWLLGVIMALSIIFNIRIEVGT